jgi:hypothetical protein
VIKALLSSGLVLLSVSRCEPTELRGNGDRGVGTKLFNTERVLHWDEILSYIT